MFLSRHYGGDVRRSWAKQDRETVTSGVVKKKKIKKNSPKMKNQQKKKDKIPKKEIFPKIVRSQEKRDHSQITLRSL